jgi:hypothetical protein
VEIVEVQLGSYLGEDDIVRLKDVYQRAWSDIAQLRCVGPVRLTELDHDAHQVVAERNTVGNGALIPAFSAAELLIWEKAKTERNIFVRGEVFALSGDAQRSGSA